MRIPNLIVFLLSNVFAYLLYQRGYLVFHASSVCINGNSYFFCGRSGSGKSTILSKLLDHGEFISEDIVCIGKGFDSILCSFPFIKLADNISFKNESIYYPTLTDARNRKIYPINTKINKKNNFSKGFFLKVSNCNSAKKINTTEAFKGILSNAFFSYPIGNDVDVAMLQKIGNFIAGKDFYCIERKEGSDFDFKYILENINV